jgi:putative ABC transport system permease protein
MSPRNWLGGEFTILYKNKTGSFQVQAVGPDYFGIDIVDMVGGRGFNQNDARGKRKVAVLGFRAREVLFGDKDPIGEYINIKGGYFKVIGYFKKEGNNGRFEERIFIPHATYQTIFNPDRDVNVIALTAANGVEVKKLEDQVRGILAKRHRFSEKDEQAIGLNNNEEEWKRFQGLFGAIRLFVSVIGTFTLIAGAVGVSNIMLIIVKERTREIGIRKAIGATPWSIVSQILMESIFITAFSGYLGLLAGVGLLSGISYLIDSTGAKLPYFTRPEVDFGVALAATAVLVVAGAIAGFVPAIKAARIKPIEALRAE